MLVCQPLLMVGRRDGLVTQQLIGLTRTRVECLLLGVVTRCSRCCAAADCSCTSLLRYHCDRELRIHLRKACFQVNLSLVRHPDPPAYCMEPSWVNASQVGEQLPNSLAFSGVVETVSRCPLRRATSSSFSTGVAGGLSLQPAAARSNINDATAASPMLN